MLQLRNAVPLAEGQCAGALLHSPLQTVAMLSQNHTAHTALPRSLNLKQCKRVGDAGLAAIAPKLQHLTSLCLQAS